MANHFLQWPLKKTWYEFVPDRQCRKEKKSEPRTYNTMEDMVQAVQSQNCTYMLTDGGSAEGVLMQHCGSLVEAGPGFLERDISFVIPRGWRHTAILRREMLELREEREEEETYLNGLGSCSSGDPPHLSFDMLRVFFIIAFVSCALILMVMVLDPQKDRGSGVDGSEDLPTVTTEESRAACDEDERRITDSTRTLGSTKTLGSTDNSNASQMT